MSRYKGFTLFEVMIAVAIFGIVSLMATVSLSQLIDEVADVKEQNERLAEIQFAYLQISRDIQQTVNRPVRDNYGDAQPAFESQVVGDYRFVLTKTGYRNPAKFSRSNMQRVAYQLENNNLYRLTWPVLDKGYGNEPRKQLLLSDVESVDLRFMDKEGKWNNEWPPVTNGESETGLPDAVEVSLELKDYERINRLFLLPSV